MCECVYGGEEVFLWKQNIRNDQNHRNKNTHVVTDTYSRFFLNTVNSKVL